MALRGTSFTTGTPYRLRNAVIVVTGTTVDVHQTESDPDLTAAVFDLPPGDYEILLTGGGGPDTWYLERQLEDGTYEQVDATLLTPNPMLRTVESGTVAVGYLSFILDGDEVVLEPGSLSVSINVIDGAHCDLTQADPGCQSTEKCSPVNGEFAICEAAGTVPQGGECDSSDDCAQGWCWGGNWGCRNFCLLEVAMGEPGSCVEGGSCSAVSDIDGPRGFGVCAP
jgi:hypothetical protein